MSTPKVFDVLVIGGGPAGLSLASALVRQLHTGLILDSGIYRNAPTSHMHNVPGWDHASPADYRAKVRGELVGGRYQGIEYQKATVKSVRKIEEEDIFEAVDENGTVYKGKKLGLATGVRDKTEEQVKGYAECWGRGVFHCLFCHGFEERGADSVGALTTDFMPKPEMVAHVARMAKRLSKHVNIYTNGNNDAAEALKPILKSSKIVVDSRPIASLALVESGPQVRVTFEDGTSRVEGFIVSHPVMEQSAKHLTEQLGLELGPTGDVVVNPPFNETSVKGCFAAGDMAGPLKSVVQAIYMGGLSGVGAISQVQGELEAKDEL